jgi:hypothetical protein
LNEHGVIEHDASLTRKDYGDAGNDCVSPQQNLVNQLKTFAVNGKLDITGVSKARLLRIQQEKSSDPDFDNGFVNAGTSLTELLLLLNCLEVVMEVDCLLFGWTLYS